MARGDELAYAMAADVAGAPNDEYFHIFGDLKQRCIAFVDRLASAFSFSMSVTNNRIVITGIGLTAPNGNSLAEFRSNLLAGVARISEIDVRYMGRFPAGVCNFDPLRYQKRKDVRVGTRAGSIGVYCAREALADAGLSPDALVKDRTGVFIGITEHGNVETENEIYNISQFKYDTKFWTHYHNPRTVANNPAGEVSLHIGSTGPAYTLGAACAAGNVGMIHATQMLRLGEVDFALCGGVSESIQTFGIFAGFKSQNALGSHPTDINKTSRPFDRTRNGIVISEGGCLYTLERLESAIARGAKIYGEIAGYAVNSDATDYVLPNPVRQAECIRLAIARAGLKKTEIDLINTHATATPQGDIQECEAIRSAFGEELPGRLINNTKGFIGHCMGAAGALELAGNLPSFNDLMVHPSINVEQLDPACDIPGLVINAPKKADKIDTILNNSFGMLGINSTLIVKRFVA